MLYNEMDIQRARLADYQREANKEKLAAVINKSDSPLYAVTLAKVGNVMVKVGTELQHRYGELMEEVQNLNLDTPNSVTITK